MELQSVVQSIGTFNMSVGRPTDSLRFEVMNGAQIRYQVIPLDGLAMPVQSIVKLRQDPHPDYFTALDKLIPFAIKVLDLGPNWINESAIGSLKLEWTYSDREKNWYYKISEIAISRSSNTSEIPIARSIKFGGIISDDIPGSVLDAIEDIMDEAWLYCTGKKTSQLNLLFDVGAVSVDIPPTAEISKMVEALLEEGVEKSQIDEYLDNAGDDPTFDGFFAWKEEEEEIWQSEQNKDEGDVELVVAKSTRSKATTNKKKAAA